LERHLERQSIKPLYLFYGNEEFLMRRALARLEEGLRDRWGEAPVRVLREVQEVQEVELPELAESRVAFPDAPRKLRRNTGFLSSWPNPGWPPCGVRDNSWCCAG